MGTVQIEGTASREVKYDSMEINLIFQHKSYKSSDSIQHALDNCEDFLNCLLKMGVPMESITLQNDEIQKASYSEDDDVIKASRQIEIKAKFDTVFLNRILELISKKDYDVTFDYNYVLTNRNTIHEELLVEALNDSHKKAELIANQLGKKVTGIEKILTSDKYHQFKGFEKFMASPWYEEDDDDYDYAVSNQLTAAYSSEKETINVLWIVE